MTSRTLTLVAASFLASHAITAAPYTWGGGTGTWDTTTTNWTGVAWGNTSADEAIFGGTAGTVTINTGTGVTANRLTFNSTDYVINSNVGADVLTLSGTTPTVSVGTAFSATIDAIIAGSAGLTKDGAGTLVLNGANSYTGTTLLSGGTLVVGHVDALSGALQSTVNVSGRFLRLATNTSVSSFTISAGTNHNFTIVSDRATSGTGINHVLGATSLGGNSTITFQSGGNVSSGTAGVTLSSLSLSAGAATATTTLAPTTATLTVTGNVTRSGTSGTKTLVLAGNSDGNAIDGTISNNGGGLVAITKSGSSTWTLNGLNTYSGATTVSAGALIVNGTHTGTGAVSVAAGAKLGGDGTLAGSTTITGILAPGNSIGTLNVGNDVTWQGAPTSGSNTDWQFELGAANASDRLNLTGTSSEFLRNVSLGSNFRFDFLGSTATGTFTLVDWESTASLSGGALGTDFQLSDFSYTNLGSGNTGTFSFNDTSLQITVIPEPGAVVLGSLGLLAFLRRRRS